MGMNFNQVILAGRLTKDPESKNVMTKNGETMVTNYTLAVGSGRKGNSKTDFIDCVCWGATAAFAAKWLKKGRNIMVIGSWKTERYTNKDGYKMTAHKCQVQEHHFTGERSDDNSEDGVRDDDFFIKMAAQPDAAPNDDFIQIPDDVGDEGLPFN